MRKNSISDKIKNKNGAALITVIIIFLSLVIVVTSATAIAHSNYLRSKKDTDSSSAYFISEAGIKKYFDELVEFYDKNKDKISMDEAFAAAFRGHMGLNPNNPDDFALVEFGNIMGEEGFSEITFKLHKTELDADGLPVNTFRLLSKGHLGDNVRLTAVELVITAGNMTVDTTGFNPESLLFLDDRSSSKREILNPPNKNKSHKGPIITNKELFVGTNHGTFKGPVVTNNKVFFNGWVSSWDEAVFITSNEIGMSALSEFKVHTIFLKQGAKINGYESGSWRDPSSYPTLQNIFIPLSTNVEQLFLDNSVPNERIKNLFLNAKSPNGGKVNVYYYDPINFNPYSSPVYKDSQGTQRTTYDVESIFGKAISESDKNKYSVQEYFKSEFFLDNSENISKDDLIPPINLPEMDLDLPSKSSYGNGLVTNHSLKVNTGKTINLKDITEKKINNDYYYGAFKEINLSIGRVTQPIVLDIGDNDVVLVTEKFIVGSQTSVKVKGSGTLKIFLHGNKNGDQHTLPAGSFKFEASEFSLERNGKNVSEPERIHFYIPEISGSNNDKLVSMTQQTWERKFTASIFSKNLSFHTTGIFDGNFISEKGTSFSYDNWSEESPYAHLIFIPNGEVEIRGKTFKGTVIAQHIKGNSVGEIEQYNYFESSFSSIMGNLLLPNTNTGGGNSETTTKPYWGVIKEVYE